MKRIATYLLSVALLALASCASEGLSSNKFTSMPARFSFTPVNSISVLNSSLNSPGEWCSITLESSGKRVIFQNTSTSQPSNLSALTGYTGFYLGLSGLIVGLPNMPEPGADMPEVTCYDLACRNCYDDAIITRRLQLQEGGQAKCTRCQRTYDLNNQGIVAQGESGKQLLRYRVYYGANTLSVSNP